MKNLILTTVIALISFSCQIRETTDSSVSSPQTASDNMLKQGESFKLDKVEQFNQVKCTNNLPVLLTVEETLAIATCPFEAKDNPTIDDYLNLAVQEQGKIDIILKHIDDKPISGQMLITLETLSQEMAMHLEKTAELIANSKVDVGSQKNQLLDLIAWGNELKYNYTIESEENKNAKLTSAIIDEEGTNTIKDALNKEDTVITSD